MKHFPILFSTPMVQAILEGRKTMNRRVVKPQPNENGMSFMKNPPLDWERIYREEWKPWKLEKEDGETIALHCPYGQPGDVLWVRETYCISSCRKRYKANGEWSKEEIAAGENNRWKPSIHMPKAACRIWLHVKAVRVERLQDISEQDAIAEGVQISFQNERYTLYKNYLNPDKCNYGFQVASNSFKTLWKSINGDESWKANPWVWVVEFERCDMPTDFLTK